MLYRCSIDTLDNIGWGTGGVQTTLTTIPATLDVKNNLLIDGVLSWSYDASGMKATQVTREACLDVPGDCYVVYMQRADLHRILAYVPLKSGAVYYYVFTDTMRNAVPHTIKRTGAFATYTLDGSCLQSKPLSGKAPTATMGDVCTMVANNGWNCSAPLRNPFATDVTQPPFLLPG